MPAVPADNPWSSKPAHWYSSAQAGHSPPQHVRPMRALLRLCHPCAVRRRGAQTPTQTTTLRVAGIWALNTAAKFLRSVLYACPRDHRNQLHLASWPKARTQPVYECCDACVLKVSSGAVFETTKPVFTEPDDFKVFFKKPDTPPNNPGAAIYTGQTVFSQSAIQMKHVVIQPCGVISAHIHPRGTEWGYVIAGGFEFGMFLENQTYLTATYSPGEGVVIPQGTVHYARNTGCTNAEIVVIFDHPDPAVVYVGQALSKMPALYLNSAIRCSPAFTVSANQFNLLDCKC